MEANVKEVELGFLEKAEKWKLHCRFFPCKAGGKPAWLALKNLPEVDTLTCKKCGKQCVFLLQVYCPLGDKKRCFHRTVYLFMCKNPECCDGLSSANFIILRSQLPKVNAFYSADPPDYSSENPCSEVPTPEKYQTLCKMCGCTGPKRCSKCKIATYCCKDHQTFDWKTGHKKSCGSEAIGEEQVTEPFLFPEYELVTESEEYTEPKEKSEAERLADYEEFVEKHKANLPEDSALSKELEQMKNLEDTEDKVFQAFKSRISHEPEQVLRYQFGGKPLFVSNENRPKNTDVPNCSCGQPRVFEFQIMPQLLNSLDVDSVDKSIDWGTLLVYTCKESCEPPTDAPYIEEFLWKQDFSSVNCAT